MSGAAAFIMVVILEATGFEPPEHSPVEVGRAHITAPPDLLGDPMWSDGVVGNTLSSLLNPGRPVPPETSAIHHLIDCDLIGAPDWQSGLIRYVGGVTSPIAFAAHSAKMEKQWCTPDLVGDAPWICTYKCALRAWPDSPGHGNQVLRYWLRQNGLLRELDRATALPAHRAGPDAYVTAHILVELLKLHPLPVLLQWSDEPAVLIRVPFGKRPEEGGSRGLKWTEINDGLLHWTLERDMGEDVNHTAKLEYERRKAERPAVTEDDFEIGDDDDDEGGEF